MGPFDLPWSTWGLAGLPLMVLLFFVVRWAQGEFVTRRQYDAVQKMSDQWQHAWESSQQSAVALAEAVHKLTSVAATLEHFLRSLPSGGGDDDVPPQA